MRQFFESYPKLNWATAGSQIPWGHNVLIMQKLDEVEKRLWYVNQTVENGWSRSMLGHSINSDLFSRQGKSINNFKAGLPEVQSDLAESILKDPYIFSFLALNKKCREKEIEQGMMDNIQRVLIELGEGFAFVGRQYSLEVAGKEYFIDLLVKIRKK